MPDSDMAPNPKQVVDEVSGWLRVFDDGTVDRTWTGPPEALPLLEPVPPYDAPRDGVTVHDISGDPALRLYLPEKTDIGISRGPLPILLHFHGGGFCISNAAWVMYHHMYARLARSLPAVVVSVYMPLAPERRLPAAIDAGYDALLFLRDLARRDVTAGSSAAERLQSTADFSRVFLIGDSSGGNLVHQVAARAGQSAAEFWSPLKLSGGIPIHPGFVRSTRSKSELEMKQDPFLTLDMLDKFLYYGLPEGATKDHPITCPMAEAAPSLAGLNLPPFMVAVAEYDLVKDTEFEYIEAMKRAGKVIEVFVSKGVGHSFYLNKFAVDNDPAVGERAEELVLAIKDFVERH